MDRRNFLTLAARSSQFLVAGSLFAGSAAADWRSARRSNLDQIGPLREPDANGLRLPAGFSSRVVAVTGVEPVAGCGYRWHAAPDGGGVFAAGDGWIYVSNSEAGAYVGGVGGAGALRFDTSGGLVDAYPILSGTTLNCAGGVTPWGSWLSCEEYPRGRVWECDPTGRTPAVACPALGRFNHEAVAVDPATARLYLTEDMPDGRWYRFTPDRVGPDGRADLASGRLEVARNDQGRVSWLPVPDPSGAELPTRYQVAGSTAFNGGEGTIYDDGHIYFSTKGDNRVWAYQLATSTLTTRYDAAAFTSPVLTGVDNLAASGAGDLLVAEDGGDMQIVVLTASGAVLPLLQVTGHPLSEITGPAFTPDLRRLYFSSQRGRTGLPVSGITYEVSGPFAGAKNGLIS